jgi:hypothetical protein
MGSDNMIEAKPKTQKRGDRMSLSVYQVNNVLRVYKDQLRHGRTMNRSAGNQKPTPDRISISPEAKRKILVDKIAADIANRITNEGPQDSIEQEVFKQLEDTYGTQLDMAEEGSTGLVFKSIDEKGETIKSLSIEDSKFLAHKLHDIARETLEKIEDNRLENI